MKTPTIDVRPLRSLRRAPQASRAGFTLLELLAVFVIIGVLMAALYPTIKSTIGGGKVAACEQNLSKIGEGLLQYNAKYESWPTKSGVPFFASLITRQVWESTPGNAKKLTCPEISPKNMAPTVDLGLELGEWFLPANADQIDADFSTYAGPDLGRAKLRRFPASGNVAIIADDNDGMGNHDTATNVLWGDLSTRRLELVELQDKGVLAFDENVTYIPVGVDSPVEALQTLTITE